MTEGSGLIRGLEGVVAAETQLCDLDGANGRLAYRGYDIADLARQATFEEVCYLLWHGELPKPAQLDSLVVGLTVAREIPAELVQAFRLMPKDTDPMRVLQARGGDPRHVGPRHHRQLARRQRPQGGAAHQPVRHRDLRAPPGAPGPGRRWRRRPDSRTPPTSSTCSPASGRTRRRSRPSTRASRSTPSTS